MINRVFLIGRVGKNPEVKYTQGGKACAQFQIATSETWKNKDGGKEERTEWHRIVAWNKLGEICGEYLTKGQLVCIVGKITYRIWEKKDGEKKYITEIVANEMKMLGPGKKQEPAKNSEPPTDKEEDVSF